MKKLKAIVIGAGGRGLTYSRVMHKYAEQFEVVAVAEPIESRRNYVRDLFDLPEDRCFTDYKPLLALGKIADFAVIATMDRDHFEPAMAAIALKYELLLEKPIAPTPEECRKITAAAEANGVRVIICTVLRYTSLFNQLKYLIDNGKIGRVMSINHEEGVGNVHQTHSFVRGNWGNEERSSAMLLQKSCHDIDILQWLLGKKCKKVQSFGTLSYFTQANAPKDAPDYCIQGCPHADTCEYNAVKLYLSEDTSDWFRTACTRMCNPTEADIRKAITETQYGKCVFKCDNDVVDHQTVNMLFEDDITVTFTMNAFNKGGRFIHIMGTKGEIRAQMSDDAPIRLYDFETKTTTEIPASGMDGILGGHGGGDDGIVQALYQYLNGEYSGNSVPTIEESYYNHMLTFAAEEARRTNTVVDVEAYLQQYK